MQFVFGYLWLYYFTHCFLQVKPSDVIDRIYSCTMEIYILSNLYYSYGAAAIALPQVQAWMYMKFKCNLLIQLWNIHHVVVIPENTLPEDYDPQFFIDEIKRANRETIPEEEWLSDRLYYVDYKKKKNHLRTFV